MKTIYKSLIIMTLIALSAACQKDFLEVDPIGKLTVENSIILTKMRTALLLQPMTFCNG